MPQPPTVPRNAARFDPWTASSSGHQQRPDGARQLARQRRGAGPEPRGSSVAYVNGSTYPLVSDHALRLARRAVTHVILGRPASSGGAGAGKLNPEMRRSAGVKFVGVEWVLESLRAGTRLPEARFARVHTAAARQPSVYGLCAGRADSEPPP